MGEYSNLYVDGHRITGWKDGISGEMAILFTEDDFADVPHSHWTDNWIYEQGDERLEKMPCFQYQSTVGALIERLELLGYSMGEANKAWNAGVQKTIKIAQDYEEYYQQADVDGEGGSSAGRLSSSGFWKAHYSTFTLPVWMTLMSQIISEKLKPLYKQEDERGKKLKEENPQLHYILSGFGSSAYEFGFPSYNFDLALRAMLEPLDHNAQVVLDCSALVGWVDEDFYRCLPPKAVVLTEGTSDQRIIEHSLRLLFPHLYGYFSFPDFEATNLPGSAGQLITIIKAFVATGIRHKTIALFDNDAAGHDALRVLSSLQLPEEIRISVLPYLDFATSYPTIGPQGSMDGDINGVACSIELYLGKDILQDANGVYYPVQFSSYVPAVKRWQGAITQKQTIQERYWSFMKDVSNDLKLASDHDWDGMKLILNLLFALYTEVNSRERLDREEYEV